MALVINTNMFALNAQKALNKTQNNLGTTIQRLSTGLRINSAKDDAAGMSIANGMTSNIMGMKQATRNANDGISLAQTAEGSLSQVNDNLQAIRNLAVQASNGTNSNKDIATLQAEAAQRIEEIGRIINQAEFNGNKTLDTNGTIMLQTGANHGEQIGVNVTATTIANLDIKDIDLNVFAVTASSGTAATMQYNSTAATAAGLDADLTFTGNTATGVLDATKVTITNAGASGLTVGNALSSGYELHQKLDNVGAAVADQYVLKTTAGDVYEVTLAADASGADKEVGITVGTKINTSHAGTVGTALPGGQGTGQGAGSVTPDQVFAKLDKALDDVSAKRSQWGAIQSRLESAVENLTIQLTTYLLPVAVFWMPILPKKCLT